MFKNVLKTEKREKVCKKKMFIKKIIKFVFECFGIFIKDNLVVVEEK